MGISRLLSFNDRGQLEAERALSIFVLDVLKARSSNLRRQTFVTRAQRAAL